MEELQFKNLTQKNKKLSTNNLLTEKEAALLLKKPVLYLIRKRRIDQYYPTIHNLPFQIKDNEFVYSKEVLLAFMEKNWKKLNNL